MRRVAILTTGGTIAGRIDPQSAVSYISAQVEAAQLTAAAQGIEALATLSSERIAAVGSQNMTEAVWFQLARRIAELCDRDEADGIVITHGTDTIEETAFFLDLVLAAGRPVVLVGALRPANALGADGPANLFQAVKVAVSIGAGNRGVLVVSHNTIFTARGVQKMHTSALDAFKAPSHTTVGWVDDAIVRFYDSVPVTARLRLSLPETPSLPRVAIIYAHAEMDAGAVDDAVARGARGLVLAGVGAGNASSSVLEALHRVARNGVVVVRSTRVGEGIVERNVEIDDDELGFVTSMDLNPAKARVLLQLAIFNGATAPAEVQRLFAETGGYSSEITARAGGRLPSPTAKPTILRPSPDTTALAG